MIVADINEAKAHLGSFLAAVQAGDDVIITDHGRSIARIIREPKDSDSDPQWLERLAASGLVTLPAENSSSESFKPPLMGGRALSDIVSEDRR